MVINSVTDLKIAAPMTFVSLIFIFVGEMRLINPLNLPIGQVFMENIETLLTLFV